MPSSSYSIPFICSAPLSNESWKSDGRNFFNIYYIRCSCIHAAYFIQPP